MKQCLACVSVFRLIVDGEIKLSLKPGLSQYMFITIDTNRRRDVSAVRGEGKISMQYIMTFS